MDLYSFLVGYWRVNGQQTARWGGENLQTKEEQDRLNEPQY